MVKIVIWGRMADDWCEQIVSASRSEAGKEKAGAKAATTTEDEVQKSQGQTHELSRNTKSWYVECVHTSR